MSTTVSMPQLGETVTEGTILRWAKKVGDQIGEDEVLLEISTDKVDTEVPSPVGGTILQILVEEGETVGVGVDLVVIGDATEQAGVAAGGDGAAADEPRDEEPEVGEPEAEREAEVPASVETGDGAARPEPEDAPEPEREPEAEPEREPEPEPDEQPSASQPDTSQASAQATAGDLHPASETPSGPDTGFEAGAVFSDQTGGAPSTVSAKPGAHAEESSDQEPSDEEVEAFFTEPSPEGKPQLLSPVVRRLVRENEVDLGEIEGTGQGGRITRRDVESYLEEKPTAQRAAPAAAAEPEVPVAAEAPQPIEPAAAEPEEQQAPTEPVVAAEAPNEGETDLDRVRVRIAENMVKARQTAAHVWTSVEVDFERLERVRQAHRAGFKDEEGFSLTYLPFISRATIDALKAFPVVNSSFDLEGKKAVFHKKVDLGIAIDLNQGGLVVARVRDADGLRLVGIAREIRQLAEKARDGKLQLDDLTGSTFTITNPGPFGSFMSAPIINVPNVAILSTETVTKRPTVVTTADGQDMIAIRHIGYLGLSWDHRAFDGSTAVLFLSRIKENLETWDWEQELA